MKATQSLLFTPVARGLFFVLQVFSVYLLLRGHHLPGGGFIGGLVSAIAWVMLGMASGWGAMAQVLRVDPARMAMVGLLMAGTTGCLPLVMGREFFEQISWHWHVPFLGEWHLGTPLAFDTGVYLVVVGIAVKMIWVLGRSTVGLQVFHRSELRRYAAVAENPIEGRLGAAGDEGGTDAG